MNPGVHEVAGVVKAFINELSEPIIPKPILQDMFKVVISTELSKDEITAQFSAFMKEVPSPALWIKLIKSPVRLYMPSVESVRANTRYRESQKHMATKVVEQQPPSVTRISHPIDLIIYYSLTEQMSISRNFLPPSKLKIYLYQSFFH